MRQNRAVQTVACLGAASMLVACSEDQIFEASRDIPGPLAAEAQTVEVCEAIDFDEFAHGDAVTSVSALGMTLTVATEPWVDPPIDPAAYDTDTMDGPDPDLEWQGTAPECPACQGQGTVLIIPDNRGFDIQGDDNEGGRLVFTGFTSPVWVDSWTAVDNDDVEVPKTFEIFNGTDWEMVSQAPASGNGTVEVVNSPGQVFFDTSMRFTFGNGEPTGSGAIDDIMLCTLQERGGEGCTLGYWKNHSDAWQPAGHMTSTLVSSVFTVPADLTDLNGDGNSDTLIDALNFGGGPGVAGAARNLLKQAAAALLSASHPDVSYGLTAAQVIAQVNDALASGDRDTMIALAGDLDALNNEGCPLN